MSIRRIGLVIRYSFPAFLRNGTGISYVFLTFVLGLLVIEPLLSVFESGIFPLKETLDLLEQSLRFMLAAASLQASFGELLNMGEQQESMQEYGTWAVYLLQDQPAMLSGVFAIEMLAIPLLIAVGAFNQLSGDLQYGAIRYQLLRVSRGELFLGRFLGMTIFTWVLVSAVLAAVVVYSGLRLEDPDSGRALYTWTELSSWGVRGIIAFMILSLPYVALCSLISANVASPFGSLVLTSVIIPGVPAIAFLAMEAWEPLGKIIYLSPWGIGHRLFHPETEQAIHASLGCLGYTVAYLAIGLFLFKRRDL